MKVQELIDKLSKFDPDADVGIVFDGAHRMDLDVIWLSRKGTVLVTEDAEDIYYTEDRPAEAPTEQEKRHWLASDKIVP